MSAIFNFDFSMWNYLSNSIATFWSKSHLNLISSCRDMDNHFKFLNNSLQFLYNIKKSSPSSTYNSKSIFPPSDSVCVQSSWRFTRDHIESALGIRIQWIWFQCPCGEPQYLLVTWNQQVTAKKSPHVHVLLGITSCELKSVGYPHGDSILSSKARKIKSTS